MCSFSGICVTSLNSTPLISQLVTDCPETSTVSFLRMNPIDRQATRRSRTRRFLLLGIRWLLAVAPLVGAPADFPVFVAGERPPWDVLGISQGAGNNSTASSSLTRSVPVSLLVLAVLWAVLPLGGGHE